MYSRSRSQQSSISSSSSSYGSLGGLPLRHAMADLEFHIFAVPTTILLSTAVVFFSPSRHLNPAPFPCRLKDRGRGGVARGE